MKNPAKNLKNPLKNTGGLDTNKVLNNIKKEKPIGKAVEHMRKKIFNK